MSKDNDLKSGLSATGIKTVAATIYAAAANQDDKMMQYVGSTLLNRLESGKAEFGADDGSIDKVIMTGYYEKNSELYKDFMLGKFKDDASKKSALRAASIASALTRGTIERMPGEFWFTDDEVNNLKKNRQFNFKAVKELDRVGKKGQFRTFAY